MTVLDFNKAKKKKEAEQKKKSAPDTFEEKLKSIRASLSRINMLMQELRKKTEIIPENTAPIDDNDKKNKE